MEWTHFDTELPPLDTKIVVWHDDFKEILVGEFEEESIAEPYEYFYSLEYGYIDAKHINHFIVLSEPPKH